MRAWTYQKEIDAIASDVILNKESILNGSSKVYYIGWRKYSFQFLCQDKYRRYAKKHNANNAYVAYAYKQRAFFLIKDTDSLIKIKTKLYHELEHLIDFNESHGYFNRQLLDIESYYDVFQGDSKASKELWWVLYTLYIHTEFNAYVSDNIESESHLKRINDAIDYLQKNDIDSKVWLGLQPLVSKSQRKLTPNRIKSLFLKKTKRKYKVFQKQVNKKRIYTKLNHIDYK